MSAGPVVGWHACCVLVADAPRPAAESGAACGGSTASGFWQAELFFRPRHCGHDRVSDASGGFPATWLTPRFPDGLTVLTAVAVGPIWSRAQTTQDRLHRADPRFGYWQALASLAEIRVVYEQRFQQQSVGLTLAPSAARSDQGNSWCNPESALSAGCEAAHPTHRPGGTIGVDCSSARPKPSTTQGPGCC